METTLNTTLLSQMLKEKRGNRSLREIAKEIGDVSFVTISRIEQGKIPDVDTFIKLCKWLDVSTDTFIIDNKEIHEASTKDIVIAHLRADKELSPETSEMLIKMINLAYKS